MYDSSSILTTLSKDEYGNFILDFPTELTETLGWTEGDTLKIESFAGRIIFSKCNN